MRVPETQSPAEETLLALLPYEPSEALVQNIRAAYPHIDVSAYQVPWGSPTLPDAVTDEVLAKVTILITGSSLPKKESVPKLKYVQLSSAGANHVLDNPLFKGTDVKLCTANGVHGCVSSQQNLIVFWVRANRTRVVLKSRNGSSRRSWLSNIAVCTL